jgi:Do/DeqQ family serine protease
MTGDHHQHIRFLFSVAAVFLALLQPPPAQCETFARESPIVKAVRNVGPAVVNISSEVSVRKRTNPFGDFGLNPFFDNFFKDFFDPDFNRRPERRALGSGVIIDGRRSLIITNAHVVSGAGRIRVTLQDEREFDAEILGADPDFDLAVLKIDSDKELPSVPLGTSEDLMIGETVIAIGNPFGVSHTVTTGVVSALNRSIRTDEREFHEFIQIDASINPGNSGGPLLNINGELIGINTAIYAKAQGIGFAIPISKAEKIIADLITHGEVIEAWLGLIVQNIDAALSRYLQLSASSGVLVKAVEPSSPAQRAGIRKGDVLIAVNSRKILSTRDYQTTMRSVAVGEPLRVELLYGGKRRTVSAVAELFPMDQAEELGFRLLGLRVDNLSADIRRRYGIVAEEGVVITELKPEAQLSRIGAERGDVILRINEMPTRDREAYKQAVVKHRHQNSVVVLLQRGDQAYYITVEI